jgi:hypothetical protein
MPRKRKGKIAFIQLPERLQNVIKADAKIYGIPLSESTKIHVKEFLKNKRRR